MWKRYVEKINRQRLKLKVLSFKLYYNRYMIASTQITNTEIFTFRALLVFTIIKSYCFAY